MSSIKKVIICCSVLSFLVKFVYSQNNNATIPIVFPEFGVEIYSIHELGDTMIYNLSDKEDFKFVFFDAKGKCYCERYINHILFQKGFFENSLDTLKRYVSGRGSDGSQSNIKVQRYFEPLKNGQWITFRQKSVIRSNYKMGILQNKNDRGSAPK